MKKIKTVGFDADDTLWINETYFRQAETQFYELMAAYLPQEQTAKELLNTEIANLELLGYGAKAFTISMVETAVRISKGKVSGRQIEAVIQIGKSLLTRPVELLDGVKEVLEALKDTYDLVVVTKGDLLDQERKLKNSLLVPYFRHIEIMSDKKPKDYMELLTHLSVEPQQFVMIGNSLKSDILPVLEIGGHGIYIPFQDTWEHERAEEPENPHYRKARHIKEVLDILL